MERFGISCMRHRWSSRDAKYRHRSLVLSLRQHEECPNHGCPVWLGCAREKGWTDGVEVPYKYRAVPMLENLISTLKSTK
jgi:hypothetical protein